MRIAHSLRLRTAAAALVLALSWQASPSSANANGVPMRIPLTYLSGISNTGVTDARGEAELSLAEAMIRIEARGLPAQRGQAYQIWLVKSGTNKATAAGTFAGTPDGVIGHTGRLNGLDGYDYDLVLITVEPSPDADPAPSGKRTIGGFFTPLRKQDTTDAIGTDTLPALLPETGDPLLDEERMTRRGLGIMLLGLGGLSAVAALRRIRRRS